MPAHDDAFDYEQWLNPAHDAFVFATTASCDPFFVRMSEVSSGLPVYLLVHDGGERRQVAKSLAVGMADPVKR